MMLYIHYGIVICKTHGMFVT